MHEKGKGGGSHDHLGFSLVESQTFTSHLTMPACKERRKERRMTSAQTEYDTHRNMDLMPFIPRTDRQEELWTCLNRNTVSIAVGPAGVGKTLVALHWGLSSIRVNQIDKIYYLRSDVGVMHQRGRGALPGTLEEKMAPLVGPVYDNLAVIMRSNGAAEYLVNKKIVEPILLEDVRGRSLSNCLLIFDEAQNSTVHNVKTVLTRVGENAKVIVTGDTKQVDLDVFNSDNGLLDAYHRLTGLSAVGRVRFTRDDVVRNSVIGEILSRYED
jgi:phosphate starvation-inducible PhoH-like protein